MSSVLGRALGANPVFRVSFRVQLAGIVSLLVVPIALTAIGWLLVSISVALALVMLVVLSVGLQVAVAKRWSSARRSPVTVHDAPELHAIVERVCVQAGLTKPAIFVDAAPYANGWVKGPFVPSASSTKTRAPGRPSRPTA